jgi:phosphotransferase system enzyme I (PtsP)
MRSKRALPRARNAPAAYAALRDVEPFTRDGTRITVMMNAGLRDDMPNLALAGPTVSGCSAPSSSSSFQQPCLRANARPGFTAMCWIRPETSRWCSAPSISAATRCCPICAHNDGEQEENPAMGWRALRVALEREGLMKVQARALLEAAGGAHA